jgi:hypothetical protein
MAGFLGIELSWKDGKFEIPSCDEGVLLYFILTWLNSLNVQ